MSLSPGLAQQSQETAPSLDYQKIASTTEWRWDDELASPLRGIRLDGSEYDITISSNHQDRARLIFSIAHNNKEIYVWKGHFRTVFSIQENRLYYARFSPSGSGGEIVAVDLSSGRELWKSPLTALGPIQHSAYSNRMTLEANGDTLSIYGKESMGRYFEIKDVKTGRTVGHKRFYDP